MSSAAGNLKSAGEARGAAAGLDFQRRRKQAILIHKHREAAREHKVEFSDRDPETLISE